jgi:Holliday junction resolvase RusA-like endonuclease
MTAPAVSEYAFVALGRPATAGSHRAFVINGKARLVPADKKQRPWQETVHSAAIDAGCIPLEGPLWVELTFRLPKPASAPKRRRIWPTGARSGDVDKLARACLDPLHGIAFIDDAQIVRLTVVKDYTPTPTTSPGVNVRIGCVRPLEAAA